MTLRASALALAATAALLAVPAVAYAQDADPTPRAAVCAADTTFDVDAFLAGLGDTGLPADLTPIVELTTLTDAGIALDPTVSLEEVRVALLCDEVVAPVDPTTEPTVTPEPTVEPTETVAPTTTPDTSTPAETTTAAPDTTSVAIPDTDDDGVTQVEVLPSLPAQTGGGPA